MNDGTNKPWLFTAKWTETQKRPPNLVFAVDVMSCSESFLKFHCQAANSTNLSKGLSLTLYLREMVHIKAVSLVVHYFFGFLLIASPGWNVRRLSKAVNGLCYYSLNLRMS